MQTLKSSRRLLLSLARQRPLLAIAKSFSVQTPVLNQEHQQSQSTYSSQFANQEDQIQRSRKSSIQYMCKGALPLDKEGTVLLPRLPDRSLVSEFLKSKKITDELLSEYLSGVFSNFMEAVASKDYQSLETLLEKRFLQRLLSQQELLEKFTLKWETNPTEADKSYIIDKIFVKGVAHDRDKNDTNLDYFYVNQHENQGIRYYMHKYFVGFQPYYLKIKNEDFFQKAAEKGQKIKDAVSYYQFEDEFRDLGHKLKKEMSNNMLSMVLRVTLQYKDERKSLQSVSGPESLFDPSYTGNHILVFENQLPTPNSMALIDHSFSEFVNIRKLNFKSWKLVDVDNFMKGNSFFKKHVTEAEFKESYEREMGPPDQHRETVTDPTEFKDIYEKTLNYLETLQFKEPRSNRKITDFISKEQLNSQRKSQQEKGEEKKKPKEQEKPKEGKEAVRQ